jgi:hypothetical protein
LKDASSSSTRAIPYRSANFVIAAPILQVRTKAALKQDISGDWAFLETRVHPEAAVKISLSSGDDSGPYDYLAVVLV